jgi:hypothetical protein
MRLYGDRRLIRALVAADRVTDIDSRDDLSKELAAFGDDPSEANSQTLRPTLERLNLDAAVDEHRELLSAVAALSDVRDRSANRSLQDAIRRLHLGGCPSTELKSLLRRFIQVCDAVGYAHSRGILHRDLKPQNVMLGKFGETLVVDWGLARSIGGGVATSDDEKASTDESADSDEAATRFGEVVGTPAYMAPEQANGQLHRLCVETDVYGLGGILFAILAGDAAKRQAGRCDELRPGRKGRAGGPGEAVDSQAALGDRAQSDESASGRSLFLGPRDRPRRASLAR